MLRNLAPEARWEDLRGRRVVVLGYGAQGAAHACNLRDCGIEVDVAQREGSPRHAAARAAGFSPIGVEEGARRGDVLIFGLPDESAPEIYEREIAPFLRAGQTLGFIHGFNVHYGRIRPPCDVDVVLVAPKGQGGAVRSEFAAGRGVAALIAVQQDATGAARRTALAWAAGLGSARRVILETTFRDETETDLFGEQAVLCGGLSALIVAAFETLTGAGYPPELAYFECCHEVKIIADLVQEHGIAAMRERISGTARYGDLTRGPRVVDSHVRASLAQILDEIRSGAFAQQWADEAARGQPNVRALLDAARHHPIEQIGAELRSF